MLHIRVKEGPYNPAGDVDSHDSLEPVGSELWTGEIGELTAAALHAAGVEAEPGTWYELTRFKALMAMARDADEHDVFSAVSAPQSGVHKPWAATIQVAERSAALMVCRSIVEHVERRASSDNLWIRVE